MKNILVLIVFVINNVIKNEKNNSYSKFINVIISNNKLELFIKKCEDNQLFSTAVSGLFNFLILILVIRIVFHIIC